jgi:hypothetical protein
MSPDAGFRLTAGSLLLFGALAGLAGCGDEGVTAYRIPKEAVPAQVPPGETGQPSDSPVVRWTAPADWKPQPASGMRQASFLVAGDSGATADVSVVSFPGSGGDDLANINRWRNQVKLPPISADGLSGQLQKIAGAAGDFVVADMAGAGGNGGAGILGAWLRQNGRVWFFKMMGPSSLVEAQKAAFMGFLQSVSIVNPGAGESLAQNTPGSTNTNDLPRSGPDLSPPVTSAPGGSDLSSVPVQPEQGASLLWAPPADWRDAPGHPVRRGSFTTGAGAEVAITAFPGDVGGVLANVNRWREQAGLAPVDDAGLGQATAALDSNGLHFLVLDASDGSTPMVAALVPWGGGTWFFKLTGPPEAVSRSKAAFLAFLRTVRTP